MRLTGGEHCGRRIKVPAEGTRPTQDKVRGAIFSSLAAHIPDARVLDLFAGTGAMGLEAWSRGAARVEWVERDRTALRVLHDNVKTLQVPPASGRVVGADVFTFLQFPPAGGGYDLVFADPPYAEAKSEGWLAKLAGQLTEQNWVKPGGVFAYETEGRDLPPELDGWRLARNKNYGSTRVFLWVKE